MTGYYWLVISDIFFQLFHVLKSVVKTGHLVNLQIIFCKQLVYISSTSLINQIFQINMKYIKVKLYFAF